MVQNFRSVKEFLEMEFPSLQGKVTGENYPVEPIMELISIMLNGLQLVAMALIVFGDKLWMNVFGRIPTWYLPIKEYGFQFGIAIFFLLPQLLNKYLVTGAFEILVDGDVGYSKLNEGRMPNAQDITAIFTKLGMKTITSQS